MSLRIPAWGLLLASLAVTGCVTSPPVRFYALGAPTQAAPSGSALARVEFLPVAIPDRLNRAEMVLTDETGRLDVRDGDHWAATLQDEVRQWVADALWRRVRAVDTYQAPVSAGTDGLPQYRLALRVERFEAVPGRAATVEGSWTARRLPQGAVVSCRASFVVALPERTAQAAATALAEGTGKLAAAVAESMARMEAGTVPACGA